jgi:hypothetical protein
MSKSSNKLRGENDSNTQSHLVLKTSLNESLAGGDKLKMDTPQSTHDYVRPQQQPSKLTFSGLDASNNLRSRTSAKGKLPDKSHSSQTGMPRSGSKPQVYAEMASTIDEEHLKAEDAMIRQQLKRSV